MAEAKSKEELVRLGWLTELRRQGDRQCNGDYISGTQVCALGLLAEVARLNVREVDLMELGACDIGALAGLTVEQSEEVWRRNDGGMTSTEYDCANRYRKHTFAEIADVVAGWFPS